MPTLTKLAAELVNMPIESLQNSTRQLRLSTWRRSVLKALSQASMMSNLSDILFKELDSNQHVLESLCAHAAKACTIPVLPSRDSDLEVLISQGRITMRRRRLLDVSKKKRIVVKKKKKEEKKDETPSSNYIRAATSLSEHLGLSVDFCVLALERCDGNVNVAADFMFSNLESADRMIAQRKARLEKIASQKLEEEARRSRERALKKQRDQDDVETRQKEIERRIEAYRSGKSVDSDDESRQRRCGLRNQNDRTVFELDHEILKQRANVFKPKGARRSRRFPIRRSSQTQTRDKFAQSGDESVGLAVLHSDETTIRTPPLSQTIEHTFFSPPSSHFDTCILEEFSLSNLEQTLSTTYCRDMLRVVMVCGITIRSATNQHSNTFEQHTGTTGSSSER